MQAAEHSRRVSVIIPTHNRLSLLRETLTSVLAQQGVDLEVIVVDDASGDGTAHFLRGVRDPRLAVMLAPKNIGVCAARNRGLKQATGEWVAFVDDDDLWAPDKLVTQINAANVWPNVEWVLSGAIHIDTELRVLGGMPPPPLHIGFTRRLLERNLIPGGGSGALVRRSLARRLGGFDERLSLLGDWEMWIRCALTAPAVAVYRPLVAYRFHQGSMTWKTQRLRDERTWIEAKHARIYEQWQTAIEPKVFDQWEAESALRNHERVHSALSLFATARRYQDLRPLATGLIALLWPPAALGVRQRLGTPRGYIREAQTWLQPLREARDGTSPDLSFRAHMS